MKSSPTIPIGAMPTMRSPHAWPTQCLSLPESRAFTGSPQCEWQGLPVKKRRKTSSPRPMELPAARSGRLRSGRLLASGTSIPSCGTICGDGSRRRSFGGRISEQAGAREGRTLRRRFNHPRSQKPVVEASGRPFGFMGDEPRLTRVIESPAGRRSNPTPFAGDRSPQSFQRVPVAAGGGRIPCGTGRTGTASRHALVSFSRDHSS